MFKLERYFFSKAKLLCVIVEHLLFRYRQPKHSLASISTILNLLRLFGSVGDLRNDVVDELSRLIGVQRELHEKLGICVGLRELLAHVLVLNEATTVERTLTVGTKDDVLDDRNNGLTIALLRNSLNHSLHPAGILGFHFHELSLGQIELEILRNLITVVIRKSDRSPIHCAFSFSKIKMIGGAPQRGPSVKIDLAASLKKVDNLIRHQQLRGHAVIAARRSGILTEQDILESSELLLIDLGRVDHDGCSRLIASHIHRGGGDRPAQIGSLGAVVDRLVVALRGRRLAAVAEVQLIAVILAVGVIADQRTIHEAEHLALLLADRHTGDRARQTIALVEFIGRIVGFDGVAILFRRDHVEILDVVRIQSGGLSTGRRFVDRSQTVPSDALAIGIVVTHNVQNAMVHAGFKQTLTNSIPDKTLISHRM
nr:MAG TPA: hypothetical protein [Caudoviricetes sp.]